MCQVSVIKCRASFSRGEAQRLRDSIYEARAVAEAKRLRELSVSKVVTKKAQGVSSSTLSIDLFQSFGAGLGNCAVAVVHTVAVASWATAVGPVWCSQ